MSKNKWTPGPWEVLDNSSIIYGVNDPERWHRFRVAVANCGDELKPSGGLKFGEQRDANAFLIAAAPDLYEALDGTICEKCANRIGWNGEHDEKQTALGRTDWKNCYGCRDARAALKKARGEK